MMIYIQLMISALFTYSVKEVTVTWVELPLMRYSAVCPDDDVTCVCYLCQQGRRDIIILSVCL